MANFTSVSSKQAYLAMNYMSGTKADAILSRAGSSNSRKTKKQKVKSLSSSSNSHNALDLQDDDISWGAGVIAPTDDEDEPGAPGIIVASDRSFKKRRVESNDDGGNGSGGWLRVRSPEPQPDERPFIVPETHLRTPMGGVLTKEQLAQIRAPSVSKNSLPPQEETVYRDASGRKIDTKAERAAEARARRIREEKEASKMEWGKGVVQLDEQNRRRKELESEKTRDLARYADDKDLNESQKQESRWNDPALAFLSKNQSKGPKRPEYSGPPPPPNRFGIKPGHRWDGVDRSNGFERSLFQRGNERSRTNLEGYEWRVEDM